MNQVTSVEEKYILVLSSSRFSFLKKHKRHIWWRHHFPHYWPFVRGNHQSTANSPHKGQWRGALQTSLISAWMNSWVNNCEAGDLRRHCAHYDISLIFDVTSRVSRFRLLNKQPTCRWPETPRPSQKVTNDDANFNLHKPCFMKTTGVALLSRHRGFSTIEKNPRNFNIHLHY